MEVKTRKPKTSDSMGVELMEEVALDIHTQEAMIATIQTEVTKMKLNEIDKNFTNGILKSGRNRLETEANMPITLNEKGKEKFISEINRAASLFKHDRAIAVERPNPGQSINNLKLISDAAIKLRNLLQKVDHISEKECTLRGVSLDDFPNQLDELVDVIDNRLFESIQKRGQLNKTIHPMRLLSRNLINALLDLNVLQLFKTKKGKVVVISQLILHIHDYISDEDEDECIESEEAGDNHTNLYRYINEELSNLKMG